MMENIESYMGNIVKYCVSRCQQSMCKKNEQYDVLND